MPIFQSENTKWERFRCIPQIFIKTEPMKWIENIECLMAMTNSTLSNVFSLQANKQLKYVANFPRGKAYCVQKKTIYCQSHQRHGSHTRVFELCEEAKERKQNY